MKILASLLKQTPYGIIIDAFTVAANPSDDSATAFANFSNAFDDRFKAFLVILEAFSKHFNASPHHSRRLR